MVYLPELHAVSVKKEVACLHGSASTILTSVPACRLSVMRYTALNLFRFKVMLRLYMVGCAVALYDQHAAVVPVLQNITFNS